GGRGGAGGGVRRRGGGPAAAPGPPQPAGHGGGAPRGHRLRRGAGGDAGAGRSTGHRYGPPDRPVRAARPPPQPAVGPRPRIAATQRGRRRPARQQRRGGDLRRPAGAGAAGPAGQRRRAGQARGRTGRLSVRGARRGPQHRPVRLPQRGLPGVRRAADRPGRDHRGGGGAAVHRHRRGREERGHAHHRGAVQPVGPGRGGGRRPVRARQRRRRDPRRPGAARDHLHGGQRLDPARAGRDRAGRRPPPHRRGGPLRRRRRRPVAPAGPTVTGRGRAAAARLVLVGAGLVATRVAARAWRGVDGPAWQRANFRGATVSLTGGPAVATAATVTAAAGAPTPAAAVAALVAGLGAGGVGLYDDLAGQRPGRPVAKGFHGHLSALRRGRVTSGVVKIVGAVAAGAVATALLGTHPGRPAGGRVRGTVPGGGRVRAAVDLALGTGVVAGAVNLVNLLDLRPGRALKVGLLAGLPLAAGPAGGLAAGPVGACLGMLP